MKFYYKNGQFQPPEICQDAKTRLRTFSTTLPSLVKIGGHTPTVERRIVCYYATPHEVGGA